MAEFSKSVENTVEKEKLLVTNNFYFPTVFSKRFVMQTRNQGLFGKGLKAMVISWWMVTDMCLLAVYVSTNSTFFPKPPTTFLACFRGKKQKYASEKVCLNRVLRSQPTGYESDMLTTKLPGRAEKKCC